MTDPQEFNSLDELFRKTFSELPQTPSASGWDTPSTRVWEQVQTQIKPPRAGWSTQSILLVCGFAVVLLLGLYWASLKPAQPTAVQPATSPAPPVEAPAATAAPTTPAASPTVATPAAPAATDPAPLPNTRQKGSTTLPQNAPQLPDHTAAREESTPLRPTSSNLLPGARRTAPNTTERRQVDSLNKAPWARPLAPLPSLLDLRWIPAVPATLEALDKH